MKMRQRQKKHLRAAYATPLLLKGQPDQLECALKARFDKFSGMQNNILMDIEAKSGAVNKANASEQSSKKKTSATKESSDEKSEPEVSSVFNDEDEEF